MPVAHARRALGLPEGRQVSRLIMLEGGRRWPGGPVARPPARPRGSNYMSPPPAPCRVARSRPVGRRLLLRQRRPDRKERWRHLRLQRRRRVRACPPARLLIGPQGFLPRFWAHCRRQVNSYLGILWQMAHGPEVRALFDTDVLIRRLQFAGRRCLHV